jgi:hypothetical protein
MNQVGLFGLFVGLLANACLGQYEASQLDEFQSNRLALDDEMNKMEVCEDQKSEKWCKKQKKKGKCSKYAKECKKTCELCDDQTDNCDDTLHQLNCLSSCPTPVNGSDPANYHHILGRCYYFETKQMNFTHAMENCMTMFGAPGGRLFEPRNTVVNDEVAKKAIAISASHNWWIGIRTDPVPALRHFYWLSGGPFTSLSFGHWGISVEGTSEPNDKDGEDCVEIGHHDEKWNDRDCSETELSICEMGHEVIW